MLIGQHTAKCDFPAKGIQRSLRIKDRCLYPEDLKLFQIPITFVANANQRRGTLLRSARTYAGLLISFGSSGSVQKRIVGGRRNLQGLSRLHASKRIAARHDPIPSREKLPEG